MRDDDISRLKQACTGCLTIPVNESTDSVSTVYWVLVSSPCWKLKELQIFFGNKYFFYDPMLSKCLAHCGMEWAGQVVGTCFLFTTSLNTAYVMCMCLFLIRLLVQNICFCRYNICTKLEVWTAAAAWCCCRMFWCSVWFIFKICPCADWRPRVGGVGLPANTLIKYPVR